MMIGFEKCKWEHSCGYELCVPEFCKEYEAVPMTNADHIRSMSDEELANWLDWEYGRVKWCDSDRIGADDCSDIDCTGCIAYWLKMPYKEREE